MFLHVFSSFGNVFMWGQIILRCLSFQWPQIKVLESHQNLMFLSFNKKKIVICNQFLQLKNVVCNCLIKMTIFLLVIFLEYDFILCLNFQNKSRARKMRSYLWMHLALNVSYQLSIIEIYKKMGSLGFFCYKCVCTMHFCFLNLNVIFSLPSIFQICAWTFGCFHVKEFHLGLL
jgi:hypothetical protein